jgi:hypothetical protein
MSLARITTASVFVRKQHSADKYGWVEPDPADEDCSQKDGDEEENQMINASGYSDEDDGVGNFSDSDIEELAKVQHHYDLPRLTTTNL